MTLPENSQGVDAAPLIVEGDSSHEVHLEVPSLTAESRALVDDVDVQRVLAYLQDDEAEIRASKINPVWADTMARATDLIRKLAYATGA